MSKKGCPVHLLRVMKSLYKGTAISVGKGALVASGKEMIDQGLRQSYPMLPSLFNIHINIIVGEWQKQLIVNLKVRSLILITLLVADDQIHWHKIRLLNK
jgi:hypothetical protein